MKENKNIERLFQEKFKDFEVLPPEDSWNIIASRIENKKKKKRVIPFWLKASGIAASLFLGLLLILNYESNTIDTNLEKKVVFEENKPKNEIKNKSTNTKEKIIKNEFEVVENENNLKSENEISSNKNNLEQPNLIQNQKNSSNTKNETVVIVSNNKIDKSSLNKNENSNKNIVEKESIFLNKTNESTIVSNKNKNDNSSDLVKLNEKIIEENDIITNNQLFTTTKIKNSNTNIETTSINNNKQVVSEISLEKTNINPEEIIKNLDTKINSNGIITENNSNKNNIISNTKNNNLVGINNSNKEKTNTETINNTINKPLDIIKQDNGFIKDSTMVVTEVETEVNALEQLLKEKEEGKNADEKEKEKRSKWVISSNAAPVYFNSISEGSPIDEQFISNEKSYAQTLSYGLGVQYAITNKISIRSGINSININYNTNDVYYSSALRQVSTSSLNISQNTNAQNLVLKNAPSSIVSSSLSDDVENLNESNLASLNQEMGYIEIPLELSYKILDKKFGIEVIGGMSTLLLNKNNISLVSRGSEMNIGEANNLNDIHFSSNVGLGFNYNFWKSFQLNFQPVFKYQINTFNSNSGNFKPYIVGLYSGVSFNF
ncbi:hypothetical protein [Flavobacterium sp. HNIBRBA15423]|uniref:hypothetical protein n=1 Tax=Flavobacterium sp. HNIBRBA15423 TaxID=3458683 RepID=UPI00404474C6